MSTLSKLTKEQKSDRRWQKYARKLYRLDRSVYGEHTDENLHYHCSVNGYPEGQQWTRDYGKRNKR